MSRQELTESKLIPTALSTLDTFTELMSGEGGYDSLRQSQQRRVRVCKEALHNMNSMLVVLIERYVDDPPRLFDLMMVKELIDNMLELHGGKIPDVDDSLAPPATTANSFDTAGPSGAGAVAAEEEEDEDFDPTEEVECPVCYEEMVAGDLKRLPCGHRFCEDCVRMYLEQKINTADVVNIPCPDNTCGYPLGAEDIFVLASAELYSKYERFSILASLRTDDTARFCPKPGCEGYHQGPPEPGETTVPCNTCGGAICYLCCQVGHDGKCKKPPMTKEERLTQKWMRRKGVQPCPKCGVQTFRFGGCPDMECPECGEHWEWDMVGGEETSLEKWAFMYPRMVKGLAGAKELVEDADSTAEKVLAGAVMGTITAVVMSPLLPITLVAGPPALVIKGGRKVKRGIEDVVDYFRDT